MRRFAIMLSVIVLILSFIPVSHALDGADTSDTSTGEVTDTSAGNPLKGPMGKLGRGAANVFTSVTEVPKKMCEADKEHGVVAGLTEGVVEGAANFGIRALVGVYEILTFPFEIPKDYEPIMEEPDVLKKGGGAGSKEAGR